MAPENSSSVVALAEQLPNMESKASAQDCTKILLYKKRKIDRVDGGTIHKGQGSDGAGPRKRAHMKAASTQRTLASNSCLSGNSLQTPASDAPNSDKSSNETNTEPTGKCEQPELATRPVESEDTSTTKKHGSQQNDKARKDSAREAEAPPIMKPKRASPRKKRLSSKQLAAQEDTEKKEEAKKVPPSSLPPAQTSQVVANKVHQVRRFNNKEMKEPSRLDRDLRNKSLVSVPVLSLQSAVIRMRTHYELASSEKAVSKDVNEAAVKLFKQPIGENEDIDWVTIDMSKRTSLEEKVHQKIARHGLDDAHLLEIELEMFKKDHLKGLGLHDDKEEVQWDANRFLRTFNAMWEKVLDKDSTTDDQEKGNEELVKDSTGEEVGRRGVCPAPASLA